MSDEKIIMKITLEDFEHVRILGSLGDYFFYKHETGEVCLESCLNGYCVAFYDAQHNLKRPKICTDIKPPENVTTDTGFVRQIRFMEAATQLALQIVNASEL